MKAVVYREFGGPDVLRLEEIEKTGSRRRPGAAAGARGKVIVAP